MRRTILAGLLLAAAFAPTALATIDSCTTPATTAAARLPTGLLAFEGIVAYMDGSCSGAGVVGCGSAGCMARCPPTTDVAMVSTTYCGPVVPAGGFVTCTWAATRGSFQLITVGFDLNGDGATFDSFWGGDGGPAFTGGSTPPPFDLDGAVGGGGKLWPASPSGSWRLQNPHAEDVRVIVYPTSTQSTQQTAAGRIGCALG